MDVVGSDSVVVEVLSSSNALSLKGILDLTVPSGNNSGKGIHLYADQSIADLSIYGLGVANNGGG